MQSRKRSFLKEDGLAVIKIPTVSTMTKSKLKRLKLKTSKAQLKLISPRLGGVPKESSISMNSFGFVDPMSPRTPSPVLHLCEYPEPTGVKQLELIDWFFKEHKTANDAFMTFPPGILNKRFFFELFEIIRKYFIPKTSEAMYPPPEDVYPKLFFEWFFKSGFKSFTVLKRRFPSHYLYSEHEDYWVNLCVRYRSELMYI